MSLAAGEAPVEAVARRLRCQELPAPPGAGPVGLLAHTTESGRRFLWVQPERDLALVGVGEALLWQPSNPRRRFEEAARFVAELARTFDETPGRNGTDPSEGAGGAPGGPILFGGFAFDPTNPPRRGPWSHFGAGTLVIPELLGITTAAGTRWLVTAPPGRFEEAAQQATELLAAAARSAPVRWPLRVEFAGDPEGDEAYRDVIAAALERIDSNSLGKVVPARQVTARLSGPAGGGAVCELLRRLTEHYPTATTFAACYGHLTLLGATPELLIRTAGGTAEAEALAGSCRRGDGPDEDAELAAMMLASPKERLEHRTVVEHLRRGMATAGVRLDRVPLEPQVRSLPGIQHLCTPVSGSLITTPGRILELAGALHPTPAVAGRPVNEALEFLHRHEPTGRGWFAGPVGWTDLAGNGEFCMALRSGLLNLGSNELTLFAGSGVVEGSDPAEELRETTIKLMALPAVADPAPVGDLNGQ